MLLTNEGFALDDAGNMLTTSYIGVPRQGRKGGSFGASDRAANGSMPSRTSRP